MDTVFVAQTCHGTVLAYDIVERRVTHVPPGELDARISALLLLRGETIGAQCLPFVINPANGTPIIPSEVSPGCGRVYALSGTETASTLRSVVANTFLSAIPGGQLEANRSTPATWESFSVTPGPSLRSMDAPAVHHFFAAATACLSVHSPCSDRLMALLASSPGPATAALTEAVWPLLTLDELDWLANQLRDDAVLFSRVLEIFQPDFYAVTALPALLKWLAEREAIQQRATGGVLEGADAARQDAWSIPWRWRVPHGGAGSAATPSRTIAPKIGPEFDHLARDGYDGQLSSFAHACNASLRARVLPTKGAAIVATGRSEGVYLLEWIAHHRLLGVEAIFLYTNDNDDGSDSLLAALHTAGVIQWTRSELVSGTSAQNKAYGHALNVNLDLLEHRWALFIDLDEFLVLNPDRYARLADFAHFHELRETDAVGINWVMVGSSGQNRWSNTPLTRRNTHLLNEPNAHIKVMMRPRRFIQAHPHFPFADRRRSYTFRLANGALHEHRKQAPGSYHARAFTDEPSSADACLYHYNFKSVEEFAWKVSRNRGDFPMSHAINFEALDHVAVGSFMAQHHSADVTENDRLIRSVPGLENELDRLRSLPGVAEAERFVIARFGQRLDLVKAKLLADPKLGHLGSAGEGMRTLLQATLAN